MVFYVGALETQGHSVSLFVPLKGELINMYANLGRESSEDLAVSLQNISGELGNIIVKKDNKFSSEHLDGFVNYETLKVVINGEISLNDISISIDIAPAQN